RCKSSLGRARTHKCDRGQRARPRFNSVYAKRGKTPYPTGPGRRHGPPPAAIAKIERHMLDPQDWAIVEWPRTQQALLAVIVDTEAEFDWLCQGSRKATGVKSVKEQRLAHSIFERYGVRPTYVLDYPVSSEAEGFEPIRELLEAGHCAIGAHLQ